MKQQQKIIYANVYPNTINDGDAQTSLLPIFSEGGGTSVHWLSIKITVLILFGEKDLQWSYPGCLLFENTQKNFMLNLVLVLILECKGVYCSCKQDTKER